MARLQKIIEKLYQSSAQDLVFETGTTGFFRSAEGARPIFREALSSEQILAILMEVAPKGLRETFEASGAARFASQAPGGQVEVEVRQTGEGIRAEIRRYGRRKADQPAPPPAPGVQQGGPTPELATADAISTQAQPAEEPRGMGLSQDPGVGMRQLLELMVERGASDLHLVAQSPPILRVDGDLVPQDLEALAPDRLKAMIWSIAPERNREEWERDKDTDFAHEIEAARFRVNVFANREGIGAVLRQIPAEILTADKLGLPQTLLELCFLNKGLVLVTGPTGSGKSTTLAAMIDHVNKHRADHIITIEDPIEFVHQNQRCLVNQREVGVHTGSFKRALRAALREDPDVILVGELRDLETIAIAIETAETGHLVFGTLHTTTAASTVDRIIDQFPADQQAQIRTMLSESLRGVISQTLCKKRGGGRVAALEVLMVNSAVANLIREGKTFQISSAMQTGKKQGMMTLNDALMNLVREEVVEPREAYLKAVAKSEMRAALEREGFKIEAES